MDVNEHGRVIQHYTWTQLKGKAQLVVRKDMDVNEHTSIFFLTTSGAFTVSCI
jgi:hypothetical protein